MAKSTRLSAVDAFVGPTLEEMRSEVERVVRQLQRADDLLFGIDGRSLIGAADAGALDDGLHPGAEGEVLLADRLEETIRSLLDQPS